MLCQKRRSVRPNPPYLFYRHVLQQSVNITPSNRSETRWLFPLRANLCYHLVGCKPNRERKSKLSIQLMLNPCCNPLVGRSVLTPEPRQISETFINAIFLYLRSKTPHN